MFRCLLIWEDNTSLKWEFDTEAELIAFCKGVICGKTACQVRKPDDLETEQNPAIAALIRKHLGE